MTNLPMVHFFLRSAPLFELTNNIIGTSQKSKRKIPIEKQFLLGIKSWGREETTDNGCSFGVRVRILIIP